MERSTPSTARARPSPTLRTASCPRLARAARSTTATARESIRPKPAASRAERRLFPSRAAEDRRRASPQRGGALRLSGGRPGGHHDRAGRPPTERVPRTHLLSAEPDGVAARRRRPPREGPRSAPERREPRERELAPLPDLELDHGELREAEADTNQPFAHGCGWTAEFQSR